MTDWTGRRIQNGYLVGPDGKVIRPLLMSEEAGIALVQTFGGIYDESCPEYYLYDDEEAESIIAWMVDNWLGKVNQLQVWWKTSSYEERLVLVKQHFDNLTTAAKAKYPTAEALANIENITDAIHTTPFLGYDLVKNPDITFPPLQ